MTWQGALFYASSSIGRSYADHLPLYFCSALYFALTLGLFAFYGFSLPLGSAAFFLKFVGNILIVWLAILALYDLALLWRGGAPQRPLIRLWHSLVKRIFVGERIGNSFHALVTLTPMMVVFAGMKEKIPAIRPFSWDAQFEAWDRLIGLGHMPWEILQPVLGYPPITIALGAAYNLWFLVMFAMVLWQAFASGDGSVSGKARRLQFLMAYGFAWFFGGCVLAIVFSSAGPCFYHHVVDGPSPYAAQMTYLNTIGEDWLWSLGVQDALWTSYTTGIGQVRGISAMPSMHVTIAVILAFSAWQFGRKWGWLLSSFAGLIVLGSVHLAWHYALDSIAGIVIAILCWKSAGLIARRWLARQNAALASPVSASVVT